MSAVGHRRGRVRGLTGPRLASGLDVSALPAVNTAWNGTAASVLLVAALIAIRRRAVPVHRALVLSAFAASALFLAGYLLYHSFGDGPKPYGGPVPWLYYAILISHIILAAAIVPLGWSPYGSDGPSTPATAPLLGSRSRSGCTSP